MIWGGGYSITVTKIDLKRDEATFELIKGGARIDSTTVKSDEWFRLGGGGGNFYFEATRGDISTYTYTVATLTHLTFLPRVHLTSYESGYDSNAPSMGTTDTTPPTVTEKSPTGENVPVATRIAITFSEPMNRESVQYAFHIHDSMQNRVLGKFSWKGDTMIFTPSSNLEYDTQYSIHLYSNAIDLAYNSLVWDGWNFRTRPPNNPPHTPKTPSGSVHGYTGTSYSYSIFAKDPDGDQIRYIFDWGDGVAAETEFVDSGRSASQSHVWAGEGEYSVRVMAADNSGGESGWSPPLVVTISGHAHPTAAISANPTVITEGETISFGAEGSKPGNPYGEIISYVWDFGDESTGAGLNVGHTYPRSGHYTVTLMVTDYENLSATDSVGITVEPTSVLSVSISTDSVPSGESGEVRVWVTSDGDPVQDASVHLSTTIGSLNPGEGVTDLYGEFGSRFTAPIVDATERYTIHAKAEIRGMVGRGSGSDVITAEPGMHPTAHIEIHPDSAEEGRGITIERWYAFAVDDDGMWSEVAEFELTMPPQDEEEIAQIQTNFSSFSEYISEKISDPAVLATMIAALAAGALLIYRSARNTRDTKNKSNKTGSIHATSDPSDAVVFVDVEYKGRSPKTVENVLVGAHNVLFLKRGYFGYARGTVVVANQTTQVQCDLTKMPEVKLKLSAAPAEITADHESRSTIRIGIVTKDDNEIPIPVPEELAVVLETDIGTIESPVKIPRGRASVTSTLISSTSSGTATVKAAAEYGKIVKLKGSTTVEFLDAESE